jgi:hypothetical protein
VIHPHSPVYTMWNNVLFMMLYPFIIAPVQAGFGLHHAAFKAFQWINQVSLLSDNLLTFWVAVLVGKTRDHVEKRPLHVAKHYVKSWFLFDLLTTLPWHQVLPLVIGKSWITETKPIIESFDLVKILRCTTVAHRASFLLPNYGMKYAQRSMIVFVLLVMERFSCSCSEGVA